MYYSKRHCYRLLRHNSRYRFRLPPLIDWLRYCCCCYSVLLVQRYSRWNWYSDSYRMGHPNLWHSPRWGDDPEWSSIPQRHRPAVRYPSWGMSMHLYGSRCYSHYYYYYWVSWGPMTDQSWSGSLRRSRPKSLLPMVRRVEHDRRPLNVSVSYYHHYCYYRCCWRWDALQQHQFSWDDVGVVVGRVVASTMWEW